MNEENGKSGLHPMYPHARAQRAAARPIYCGNFPHGVGEVLGECQRAGYSFDEAWALLDLDMHARTAGYKSRHQKTHEESSLAFAKRHLRAAYDGEETHNYCVVTDCVALTLNQYGLCETHALYEASE